MSWLRTLSFTLAASLCAAGEIREPFQLQYSLPDSVVLLEPVILDVVVRNDSDRSVHVDLGLSNVRHFRFEVIQPAGLREVVQPLGRDGFQPSGRYVVEPGRLVSAWIVLNEWLKFRVPGVYRVRVAFHGSIVQSGGDRLPVHRDSERTLVVLPRDDGVLRERCEDLLSQVRTFVGDDQVRAATALAHVFDPIAIPYLRAAAEFRHFPNAELAALVSIGGAEARAALEALSKSSNPWTARMAKSALARIK